MDLSHLSDEQLQGIASGKPQSTDLSMMSDEDLHKIASQGKTDIVQEMHPEFTTADRLIVQNLSNNNEASVNYLQKQHPDLEVKVDDFSGQILARKRDGSEQSYKVLDPDTGFFSKDILNDTGDVLGDVASGIGTTAATAAGGLLGGLPGAAGLGAVTSGGLEAIRQYLGKAAGVNNDVDNTQVGLATAAGGISPLLFGTGATATQVATKSINPFAGALSTLKGEAAPVLDDAAKALMKDQSGVLGRLYTGYRENLAPKLGSTISGIPTKSIEMIRDNPGLLDELRKTGELNNATQVTERNTGKVLSKSSEVGSKLSEIRKEAGSLTREYGDELKAVGDRPLTEEEMAALGKAAGVDTSGQLFDALHVDTTVAKKPFEDLLAQAKVIAAADPSPAAQEPIQEIQGIIDHYFTADKLPVDAAWNLRKAMDQLGKRAKPGQGTASGVAAGASQLSKEVIQAGKEAANALNGEMDRVGSLFAQGDQTIAGGNRLYSSIQGDRTYLKKFTKDPEAAAKQLQTLANDGKTLTRQRMEQIDKRYGTDFLAQGDKLRAFNDFNRPAFAPKSAGGTTSTSRTIPAGLAGMALGSWIGANSGLGQGVAWPGAMAGGALGAFLGGPAALKAYMATQRGATALGTLARDSGLKPAQLIPSWLLMNHVRNEP